MASPRHTSVQVSKETHHRLKETKPYQSMSFDELVSDMLDNYDPPCGTPASREAQS
jgi:hypothetical protein